MIDQEVDGEGEREGEEEEDVVVERVEVGEIVGEEETEGVRAILAEPQPFCAGRKDRGGGQ